MVRKYKILDVELDIARGLDNHELGQRYNIKRVPRWLKTLGLNRNSIFRKKARGEYQDLL